MKNKAKTMIAIIALGISITACRHQIDQSVIQTYVDENTALDQKVSYMKAFKNQTISDIEKKQAEMIAAIDPKKKAAFEKDNTIKSEMNVTKEKIDKAAKEFEGNYNSLIKSIESNNTFILAIPNSEQKEESIKADWQQNMVVFNGIVRANNEIQKEMIGLSQQYNELIKQVYKKYGKTEPAKKAIKKNKK